MQSAVEDEEQRGRQAGDRDRGLRRAPDYVALGPVQVVHSEYGDRVEKKEIGCAVAAFVC